MLNSLNQLSALLQGTELADAELFAIDILNTGEQAFAIRIEFPDTLNPCIVKPWKLLRQLVDQTGRWPVITRSPNPGEA